MRTWTSLGTSFCVHRVGGVTLSTHVEHVSRGCLLEPGASVTQSLCPRGPLLALGMGWGRGNNKDACVWGWLPTCVQESLRPARPHGQTAMHCTPVSGHSKSHSFSPPLWGGVRAGGRRLSPRHPVGNSRAWQPHVVNSSRGDAPTSFPAGAHRRTRKAAWQIPAEPLLYPGKASSGRRAGP